MGKASAREGNNDLKGMLGKDLSLSRIFTPEKIAKCQQIVEEAKLSFFEVAAEDMAEIEELSKNNSRDNNTASFYEALLGPLCNIKGQADIFGFNLISTICKYLLEYSLQAQEDEQLSEKDIFVIEQLVAALKRCFEDEITDKDGKVEKQLAELMEAVRK